VVAVYFIFIGILVDIHNFKNNPKPLEVN
jgi:hypothetical protein